MEVRNCISTSGIKIERRRSGGRRRTDVSLIEIRDTRNPI